MSIWLFENYSHTSNPSSKRGKYKALEIKQVTNRVYQTVLDKISSDGFYNIKQNKEYNDICAYKNGFELSIQISASGAGSILEFSVFGEHKRGKTRRFFKKYYYIFSDLFNL